jgi:2-amino-4-hydroxy-6-hydroxymethyldihydropteridine diphosphokinase
MRSVVVGLGSNLGARTAYLVAAVELLATHPAITVAARSCLVATPALTQPQPDFLNAAVRLHTALSPDALLDVLLDVERALGRERRERWGARTVDLDILCIRNETIDSARLSVPHPGLLARAFALFPLLAVLEADDPARPSCEAAASHLSPPPRRPWPTPAPTGCMEIDTNGPGVLMPAHVPEGPSARAERLAAAVQAALDAVGGACSFGEPAFVLGHLDDAPGALVPAIRLRPPARVLVSPEGAVLGLGARAVTVPEIVLSTADLYPPLPASRAPRARPTGAPG